MAGSSSRDFAVLVLAASHGLEPRLRSHRDVSPSGLPVESSVHIVVSDIQLSLPPPVPQNLLSSALLILECPIAKG